MRIKSVEVVRLVVPAREVPAGRRLGWEKETADGEFNDRFESIVIGMTDNRVTDLAGRTIAQATRLASASGGPGATGHGFGAVTRDPVRLLASTA